MSRGKPKGIPATKRQAEAGAANLAKWKADQGNPEPARTHGAFSSTIRQRYSDLRTTEGQKLKSVIDSIIADIGGTASLNAFQNVIIGGLRGKFIVIFQISDYLDRQSSIIDSEGNVLACLRQTYLTYMESANRDLERLYGISRAQLRKATPKL